MLFFRFRFGVVDGSIALAFCAESGRGSVEGKSNHGPVESRALRVAHLPSRVGREGWHCIAAFER